LGPGGSSDHDGTGSESDVTCDDSEEGIVHIMMSGFFKAPGNILSLADV
jgi:hypothetical protein